MKRPRDAELPDFVLHQAALPSVQRSVAEPRPTHDVNATDTLELLMAAREAGVRRFVFPGSSSAYGDTETMPKTEDAPPRPGDVRHSLAGLAKIRERLGYEPAVELEEGLRRTVEWFRAGGS